MSTIYDDFVKQIKAEAVPPEGAFTMNMFMKDTGIARNRAGDMIEELIEAGKIKKLGRFASVPGSAIWYLPVKP